MAKAQDPHWGLERYHFSVFCQATGFVTFHAMQFINQKYLYLQPQSTEARPEIAIKDNVEEKT